MSSDTGNNRVKKSYKSPKKSELSSTARTWLMTAGPRDPDLKSWSQMFKETEEKKKEREKEREGKPFDRIRARNDWLARVAAQRKASEKEGAEEEDHKEEVEEDSGEKYEDVTEEAVTEQVEIGHDIYSESQ